MGKDTPRLELKVVYLKAMLVKSYFSVSEYVKNIFCDRLFGNLFSSSSLQSLTPPPSCERENVCVRVCYMQSYLFSVLFITSLLRPGKVKRIQTLRCMHERSEFALVGTS